MLWRLRSQCVIIIIIIIMTFELATLLMFLNVNLRLIFSTLPMLPSHVSSPHLRITFSALQVLYCIVLYCIVDQTYYWLRELSNVHSKYYEKQQAKSYKPVK